MRKLLKWLTLLILSIVVVSTLFFIWASSPQLSEADYEQLITNDFESKQDNDSIYSIVSYNIGYLSGMSNNQAVDMPKSLFEANLLKAKQLFSSINADILSLQEIDYESARSYYINQQDELANLGYNHIARAVNWDETYVPFPYWPPAVHFGEMLSGQSILSRFQLKDHQRIVLERVANAPFYRAALYLERLAQVVTATIANKDVIIINVHLEAFDKETRIKQFNDVLSLFEHYSKNYPTILLGDFNSLARDKESVIQKLVNNPLVGNAAFDKQEIANTFSATDPYKRIDYIFYTKNTIEYHSGNVLKSFGDISDHLPVLMEFKLKH